MTAPQDPQGPGAGPWQPRGPEPQSAQGWVDRATSQGVPPDYSPPVPPGTDVNVPHGNHGQAAPPPTPPPAQQHVPSQAQQQQSPQAPSQQQQVGHAPQQQHPGQQGQNEQPFEPLVNGKPQRRIVDTSGGKQDGLERCPKCGSTDVAFRANTGKLICHFCRYEWNEGTLEERFGFDSPIDELRGTLLGSGASRTSESTDLVVTLKCGACGAEIVVNTAEALQARCHWCRNTLSVNEQLPNGAVPDGVLPFSVSRDDAIARINAFVKKRRFFAHPKFVKEFAATEVVGVYLPYLTVDANVSIELEGSAEIKTAQRRVKRGNNYRTVYDADVYRLGRRFDLLVDDIQLESSEQRADQDTSRNTNNIINAILPFDVKQSVTYNANYLRGYTSERRDLNLDEVMDTADEQMLSVARSRANETTKQYDRGVRWESEKLDVHGTRWLALYVPVWLYSFYHVRKGVGLVHYVAVNGRSGETMGSVPLRRSRLLAVSIGVGVVGTILSGGLAVLIFLAGM